MPSSSHSLSLCLFLLCAVVIIASAIAIGGNINAEDDASQEFHAILDRMVETAKNGVQQLQQLLQDANATRLNNYFFNSLDKDKDGTLSQEELEAFAFDELLPTMIAFGLLQKDLVEKKLARTMPVLKQFVGLVIEQNDLNGDGKLSWAETEAFNKKNQQQQPDIKSIKKMLAMAKARTEDEKAAGGQ